jgi:site-specific DNA-methyltransferase (adenine-specific)
MVVWVLFKKSLVFDQTFFIRFELMKTKHVKISEIKSNPNNPRLIKDDKFHKLVKSIQEFPKMLEIRPIVVNADMIVLGGNMRLKACKEAGLKEIPVIFADDLTEEQQREFIIKDNVGFGEWDWEMIANGWDSDKLEEWGLDIPDFEVKEELSAEEDDFDEAPPENPITVLGDLYEIGEHRLLCGDSTQTDTFEKLMQGELADMVVTDPPYNVALGMETKEQAKARNRRTDGLVIQNDKMSNDDFYTFLYDFYSALSTAVKKGGSIYVWYASSEVVNFVSALVNAGWLYKQELIWNKTSMIMGRQDYQWKHEPCLYGWLEGGSHNWYSDRKQTTVIEWDKPQRNGEHPTMKPIGLFAYQIENSSKQGDIVIDAFGGSGTTMVACEQIKRKARIIEFDPKYCDVIVRRMVKLDPTISVKRNGVDCKREFE